MADNKTDKSIDLENARVKYQVAIDKNISESEIQWSRYNAILFFNSILIAAIGFVYDNAFVGNILFKESLALFLPLFGLIICFLWLQMTIRGFQWIDHWIGTARKIEKNFLSDQCDDLNPILEGNEFSSRVVGWPRTPAGSYVLIVLIAILYIILLLGQL